MNSTAFFGFNRAVIDTYPTAISLLANEAIDVESLIDFEMPLNQVDKAFHQSMQPESVKGMIDLNK